jgi:hypothetical protein
MGCDSHAGDGPACPGWSHGPERLVTAGAYPVIVTERRRARVPLRREVVELLRQLPTGSVVTWADTWCQPDPMTGRWCDVWAPALARPLGMGWIWTIHPSGSASDFSAFGALELVVVQDIVTSEGERAWSAAAISGALEDWVAVWASRTDLTFACEPELMSDLAVELLGRAERPPAAVVEAPDGELHELVEHDARLWTACGLRVEDSWTVRSAEILLDGDLTDEELDRLLSAGCARCREARSG